MVGTAPVVAGVDSSTQSTKVEVRDLDSGAVISRGAGGHPVVLPPRAEQDPESWWSAFQEAWAAAGPAGVAAVAVAAQQHGMVALDAERQVLRDAKLWNDTESAPDAAWLHRQLEGGAARWADACGSVPVAAFTVTKLSWLHRTEPDVWERLAHVVLPHDWLTYRMTGRLVTDRGDASGTGYWSPRVGEYRFDLLGVVDRERDWSDVVPEVLGPDQPAGTWGGAVVGPGTGDNMAAALGLGLAAGDVVVSVGTSGTVFTVSETPTHDPSGAVAGFASADGRFLPLVCTSNATRVTDAVARLLGVDHAGFDALALAAPPGSGGLTLLPYLDGERTPDRPTATGTLAGLRSDVTREQLARAAVEGVVCSLLDGLDALGRLVPTGGRLFLVGGGARSAAYRTVLADIAGREVLVPDLDEAVAAGAAVQAATMITGESPAAVAARWQLGRSTVVEPGGASTEGAAVRARYGQVRDA
jgi:xylulokinase